MVCTFSTLAVDYNVILYRSQIFLSKRLLNIMIDLHNSNIGMIDPQADQNKNSIEYPIPNSQNCIKVKILVPKLSRFFLTRALLF